MNYFFLYQILKAQFSSGAATHTPDERAFGMLSQEFHSTKMSYSFHSSNLPFDIESALDNPNLDFSYPIFHPTKSMKSDGCIILLHGLNERSWEKYLPWGYQLANYTRKTIILFPIAYHMNRSPKAWCNPRLMRNFVKDRQIHMPMANNLSVANVALSERLTNHPERFLLSGYQAANDLLALVEKIKQGRYPLVNKGAQVDFFAYSIGAFLAQVMMMAHGEDKLAESRLFMFCGGSAFEDWQGVSKYIMDSVAFERLHAYYRDDVCQTSNKEVQHVLNETPLGQAFLDLLSVRNLKRRGEGYYASLKERISAVVLKNDTVVIADKVKMALKGMRVDEWDLNYKYSHIMPFPLLSNKLVNQVNEAFDKLMLKSSLLFTT